MESPTNADRDALVHELTHGFKNVITALRMGCNLVDQSVQEGDAAAAAELLNEMRKELENGSDLVARISDLR